MRRVSGVGVFMLVLLALATHVTAARAAGSGIVPVPSNTITRTAITSPADPSYFYDPTAGAYGGVTVTGTTNSSDPSSDKVDIDCYADDGNNAETINNLVSGVSLNANGGFSTTVPYSAIEQYSPYNNGECRLRAVPSGDSPAPSADLGSFAGPRVLLAYLAPNYTGGSPSALTDYALIAPQLGAINSYAAAGDPYGPFFLGSGSNYGCGLSMNLASPDIFGQMDTSEYSSFYCADPYSSYATGTGGLQVDGQTVQANLDSGAALTVSATQNPANGDLTIHETEPLDECSTSDDCATYVPSGVEDVRTIQQTAEGHVSRITDDFVSTESPDGPTHQVSFDLSSTFKEGADSGGTDHFTLAAPSAGSAPGSFLSSDAPGSVDVGSTAPGTIYGYNDQYSDGSSTGFDALTYFTAPSGPVSFEPDSGGSSVVSTAVIPFSVTVPAGGSQAVSVAYASEYSYAALAGDLQAEVAVQQAPTITLASPIPGATVSTPNVNVSGSVSAFSGVSAVSVNGVPATVTGSNFSATVPLRVGANPITAVVTTYSGLTGSTTESVTYTPPTAPSGTPATPATVPPSIAPASVSQWAGPIWLPIANTGSARRRARAKEALSGEVTPGSGAVTYYFQYGLRGHLSRRTAARALPAGKASRRVVLTIGGLRLGADYRYRLVVGGTFGHATGRIRSFRATVRHK